MPKTQTTVQPFSLLLGAVIAGIPFMLSSIQTVAPGRQQRALSDEKLDILDHMSVVYLQDSFGSLAKTIRFEGVNVQIINGLGATNGNPNDPNATGISRTRTNGLGNLIVGYNEKGNVLGDERGGSHNIVVGQANSYSSFGGIVGNRGNTTSAPFASVVGGEHNHASAVGATVSGGAFNVASFFNASVSGGQDNKAAGPNCSVSGGVLNFATGKFSSISGGISNMASGGSILGGRSNTTQGFSSTISGGTSNMAASGSVSGGRNNAALGFNSTIGGGENRTVLDSLNWGAGSLFERN